MLTDQVPVLITSRTAVPTGRDGGVTLWGTAMAATGGAIMGALTLQPLLILQGALWGVVGSTLDSM